jgi:hypothetical protein
LREHVLPGRNSALIPEVDETSPSFMVRLDPALYCDYLTCVDHPRASAYCSRECSAAEPCPESFECQALEPGSQGFCVNKDHECTRCEP